MTDVASIGDPPFAGGTGADAVRDLGRAYIAKTPDEADLMATRGGAARRPAGASRYALEPDPDFLSTHPGRHFDAERTVWLDGWLLSRNEGRRLAVFALNTAS